MKEPADGCGGETPIMKNNDLQSRLDPNIIRKLDEKHIKYERYMPSTRHRNYISWQDGFKTKDRKVPALYAVLIARFWLFVLIFLGKEGGQKLHYLILALK